MTGTSPTRWELLFADLEARFAAEEAAEREGVVADLTRAEQASVGLTDRLRAVVGRPVRVELLDREGHGHHERTHGEVTVEDLEAAADDELLSLTASELRDRARDRGLEHVGSMSKAELVEALRPHLTDHTDDAGGAE